MAKSAIKFPGNGAYLHLGRLMREIEEMYPKNTGFLLLNVARAAKQCGCQSLACPSCGLMRLHLRVRRIANNQNIKTGYLTGGVTNKSMI